MMSEIGPIHIEYLFERLWPWLLLFTLTRLPTLLVRVWEFTQGHGTHSERLWIAFFHDMSDASFGVGNAIVWCCNRRLDKKIENARNNDYDKHTDDHDSKINNVKRSTISTSDYGARGTNSPTLIQQGRHTHERDIIIPRPSMSRPTDVIRNLNSKDVNNALPNFDLSKTPLLSALSIHLIAVIVVKNICKCNTKYFMIAIGLVHCFNCNCETTS